jgi:predicted nucleotidyltransferase/predicted transcriptional regulator with HTH domain
MQRRGYYSSMTILLNTRLRRNLLTYTFTHPNESYYVRELAGLINEDPGNLSRELKKLEVEGLYTSVTKGNMKLYLLNKRYPLYAELKTIIAKTTGIEGKLKEIVTYYLGISLAFIYGSYATNTEQKSSDIDVILVGKFSIDQFTSDIHELESQLNREINFTAYSKSEFEKEKKVKGGFLQLILEGKIILLKGGLS